MRDNLAMDQLAITILQNAPLVATIVLAIIILWQKLDSLDRRMIRLETKMEFILNGGGEGKHKHAASC